MGNDKECQNPNVNNRRGCVAMESELINEKFENLFSVIDKVDKKLDSINSRVEKMSEEDHKQNIEIERIKTELGNVKEKQKEHKEELEKQIDIIHKGMRSKSNKMLAIVGLIVSVGAILTTVIITILK
jgi:septal ring factor EnvC (AmiA/AmiB activator)